MVKAWCCGLLNPCLCRIWQHGGDPVQRTAGRGLRRWRGAPAAGQLHGQGRPTKCPSGWEVGTSRKYSVFLSFCSWRILQGRVWEILATKFRVGEDVHTRGGVWDADVNTDVWRCNVTLWQPTRGRCLEASKEKRIDAECGVFQHPWFCVVKDKNPSALAFRWRSSVSTSSSVSWWMVSLCVDSPTGSPSWPPSLPYGSLEISSSPRWPNTITLTCEDVLGHCPTVRLE